MKAFMKEFKEFIAKGNVMDMAIGIIIGGGFTAIVNSLVNDIVMPLLSIITGGFDFSNLAIPLGSGEDAAQLCYGAFISAVINFLLIAIVIFCLIKALNKLSKKEEVVEEAPATTKVCPYCKQEIAIDATRCPHCTSEVE